MVNANFYEFSHLFLTRRVSTNIKPINPSIIQFILNQFSLSSNNKKNKSLKTNKSPYSTSSEFSLYQFFLQRLQIPIQLFELPTPRQPPLRQHLQHHIIIPILFLQQVVGQRQFTLGVVVLWLGEAFLVLGQQL